MFLTDVLTRKYSAGTFNDGNGSDTYNAIFNKHSVIEFVEHKQFRADLRQISQFSIVQVESSDTLLNYGIHLKASEGSSNEAKRNDSVERIRAVTD